MIRNREQRIAALRTAQPGSQKLEDLRLELASITLRETELLYQQGEPTVLELEQATAESYKCGM